MIPQKQNSGGIAFLLKYSVTVAIVSVSAFPISPPYYRPSNYRIPVISSPKLAKCRRTRPFSLSLRNVALMPNTLNTIITSSTRCFISKNDPPPDFFTGAPSTPGFKPGQFEKLTSWALSTSSNRPIVTEYEPNALWLWTQWKGTIREMTFNSILLNMLWALLVNWYAHSHSAMYVLASAATNVGDGNIADSNGLPNIVDGSVVTSAISNSGTISAFNLLDDIPWLSFEMPHINDPLIENLNALNSLWEYQLSLTVFILSFFTNQAYNHWRMVYFCTRAIQGRINDLCLLITLSAARSNAYGEVDGITGYQSNKLNAQNSDDTRDASKLVRDFTRLIRMSHTFFWAATPTCSDGFGDVPFTEGGIMGDMESLPKNFDPSKFGPMLLGREGLEMLVRYGQLTRQEVDSLMATGLPPSQYGYVLLEWAGLYAMDGAQSGELRGGQGMEENLIRQITQLRGEYFNIGDYNAGRMPMAYVQFLQVLVDSLVLLSPLALYPKMGAFSIISTGLLTLFFKGLLELSKSFLDPFGTEGFRTHNIRVDVLVSELNFGASKRWVDAGDALPSEFLGRRKTRKNSSVGQAFSRNELQPKYKNAGVPQRDAVFDQVRDKQDKIDRIAGPVNRANLMTEESESFTYGNEIKTNEYTAVSGSLPEIQDLSEISNEIGQTPLQNIANKMTTNGGNSTAVELMKTAINCSRSENFKMNSSVEHPNFTVDTPANGNVDSNRLECETLSPNGLEHKCCFPNGLGCECFQQNELRYESCEQNGSGHI